MEKEHECSFDCPFVIQCEGGYVCRKTGKCFGQLFDISRDGASSVLQKGSTKGSAVIKKEKGASDATHVTHVSKDDSVHEKYIAECMGILRKMVRTKKDFHMRNRVCKYAVKNAMQYLKNSEQTNIVQDVAHAEKEYQTKNTQMKGEPHEDSYRQTALCCLRCFMLSVAKQPNKSPKREYIFLAALYLLRDGLNVNEVTFIQRETYV
jgi:hypothetical protein